MEAGLKIIFLIGAVAMLLTFLIICTIPEISIDAIVEDKKSPLSWSVAKPSECGSLLPLCSQFPVR